MIDHVIGNTPLLEAAGVQWDKLPTGGMGSFEYKSRRGNETTFAAVSMAEPEEIKAEMKKMVGDNPLVVF
jgi:hypothetical protein